MGPNVEVTGLQVVGESEHRSNYGQSPLSHLSCVTLKKLLNLPGAHSSYLLN